MRWQGVIPNQIEAKLIQMLCQLFWGFGGWFGLGFSDPGFIGDFGSLSQVPASFLMNILRCSPCHFSHQISDVDAIGVLALATLSAMRGYRYDDVDHGFSGILRERLRLAQICGCIGCSEGAELPSERAKAKLFSFLDGYTSFALMTETHSHDTSIIRPVWAVNSYPSVGYKVPSPFTIVRILSTVSVVKSTIQ